MNKNRLRAALLALLIPAAGALAQATHKDAAALGRALAEALNQRSVDSFLERVDTDAFSSIVLRDLGLSASDAAALRKRLPLSLRKNVEMTMRSLEQNEGSARFLRAGTHDGRAYALVRVDQGDQGVEYLKYYASSPARVDDWYMFTAASLFSSAVRFNLATLFKSESVLYKLLGAHAVSPGDARAFLEVRDHLANNDYPAAFQALEKFPPAYRKSRQWALMRVTLGGRAGDERYREALRHLAAGFGGDPDLQLALIDHYFYENQLERALGAVAALEQAVGGEDASTQNLRGSLYTGLRRFRDAETACRRGVALEADFKPAYWCLVQVAIERNDGRLAVEVLGAYEKTFAVTFDPEVLAQQQAYKAIGRTPEFAAWAKARRH